MAPYQERVVQEKKELDEKLVKLNAFLLSDQFTLLPTDEQGRLNIQRFCMDGYSRMLGERILAFK